jgi:hypothetical protein
MGRVTRILSALLAVCGVSWGGGARGAVLFTNNSATWAALQPVRRSMALTAQDVQLSTEVNAVLTNEQTTGGKTLTFPGADTGFDFSFRLKSLTNWPFTYRDNLPGPSGTKALTSANVQVRDLSDWEVAFTGGREVRAFGFNLIDNEFTPAQVLVYGAGDVLLGSSGNITAQNTFVGVTSDAAISRVMFDHDVDVAFFNGLMFGYVPEPSGVGLLMVGAWAGCAMRSRLARVSACGA